MTPARLLLVDDDEAGRDLLIRRLSLEGYLVDAAGDGNQALELVAVRSYDLVLLDYLMPGLNGLEVLRRIRERWTAFELPVIMVTAFEDGQEVVAALSLGANDYITKPLDFSIALARIQTRLRLVAQSRELRRSNDFYQLAMRASEEGLWDWDLITNRLYYSGRWKSMLGYAEDEITEAAQEWFSRVHPADLPRVSAAIQASLEGKSSSLETEYRVRHKDGRYRWVVNHGSASRDPSGRAVRLAGHQTDVTDRKTIDPVTSLPNRTWLDHELESIAAARCPAALLLIGLERFERLVESLPPGGADRLLAAVAGRLLGSLEGLSGSSVAIAHYGPHHFAVLLHGSATAQAREVAGRLLASLCEPVMAGDEPVFVMASAGIAVTPAAELLRSASAALRHARATGSACEIFQAAIHQQELAETRLENDLRRALERSEFLVHYQPKVDLASRRIVGFEALVRWNRPGHGLVPPDHFIGLAERTGLIVPIGRFVLSRACRDIVGLRTTFPDIKVSVNVSGRQLLDPALVEQVRACLDAAGLEPSALQLEITETFLVQEPDRALGTLNCFREMGVGLKLDDFGSGYASLDYLRRFPFDTLKVDRTFVASLLSSRESAAIVRAIAGLARSLRLEMVAEGIETQAQLERLSDLGCDYGQGYWFSPPVEFSRLHDLLQHQQQPKGVTIA